MYTLIENFCLGTRRLEVYGKNPSSLRRGWVTVLGESEYNKLVPEEQMTGIEGGTTLWDKESWENGIKALANGGKFVVPMSTDIDALRPKSPFRSGSINGASGGTSGGTPVAISNGPRVVQPIPRPGFGNPGQHPVGGFGQGQNQMMVPPVLGMGMNPMGGLGTVGDDGMVPGMVGWGLMGMGNMGMNGLIGMGPQGQMGMGQMGGGGGYQGQEMGDMFGMAGFNGNPGQALGMSWLGAGNAQAQQTFMENQGMWDGVQVDGMGMDMSNGMGLNNMGMMGGMGMGMGQWGTGGYDGY